MSTLGQLTARLRQLLYYRVAALGVRPPMATVFGRIHRRKIWGSGESVPGPGSTRHRAADFMDELLALLRQFEVGSLLDAPCGDFNWAQPLADAVEDYTGLDVVPELIAAHRRNHAASRHRFLCGDLTRDALPAVDLIFCRDCLVHFSSRDVAAALRNFRRSGSRYLLTTTFIARTHNPDILTGQWRALNLQCEPFGLPPPVALIDERCTHTGGIYRDKRLALWRLSDLPQSLDH